MPTEVLQVAAFEPSTNTTSASWELPIRLIVDSRSQVSHRSPWNQQLFTIPILRSPLIKILFWNASHFLLITGAGNQKMGWSDWSWDWGQEGETGDMECSEETSARSKSSIERQDYQWKKSVLIGWCRVTSACQVLWKVLYIISAVRLNVLLLWYYPARIFPSSVHILHCVFYSCIGLSSALPFNAKLKRQIWDVDFIFFFFNYVLCFTDTSREHFRIHLIAPQHVLILWGCAYQGGYHPHIFNI